MTVKFTGKQFKEFWAEEWPDSWWCDEEEVWVNGILWEDEADIEDTDQVKLVGGTIYTDEETNLQAMPLEKYARKWLKAQNSVTFLVVVNKELADAVRAACKELGGKVIT